VKEKKYILDFIKTFNLFTEKIKTINLRKLVKKKRIILDERKKQAEKINPFSTWQIYKIIKNWSKVLLAWKIENEKMIRLKKELEVIAAQELELETFLKLHSKLPRIRLMPVLFFFGLYAHLGNPKRIRSSYEMNKYILAYRNEISVLNLLHGNIAIRKAVAQIFIEGEIRGTLAVYNPYQESYPIYNNSVVVSIQKWVPGIISNFVKLAKTFRFTNFLKRNIQGSTLTRNQRNNQVFDYNVILEHIFAVTIVLALQLKIPSLALCFSPTILWLREIASIGIPSVCILDTDAYHTNDIAFPVIGNSKGPQFGHFFGSFIISANNRGMLEQINSFIKVNLLSITRFQINS
jgi:ribosomal protein S2